LLLDQGLAPQLEGNFPGITDKLSEFIDELEAYAVFPDFGVKSMILRWHIDRGIVTVDVEDPAGRSKFHRRC
jgi:hypothetical protein